nr:MAG TPA: hypothetical protein [Caudoviricetes sp.]
MSFYIHFSLSRRLKLRASGASLQNKHKRGDQHGQGARSKDRAGKGHVPEGH